MLDDRLLLTHLTGLEVGVMVAEGLGSSHGSDGACVLGCVCLPAGTSMETAGPVRVLVHSTHPNGDSVVSEVSGDRTWVFQALTPGDY